MVWTRLDKRGNSHTRGWNAVVPPLLRRVGSRSGLRSQRRSGVGRTGLVELSRLPPTHRFAFEFARITNFLMASTPAWKVSTLFQNLEATQHQVLRHQRFSLWTRPSPLYRAQSGLQIRAVVGGSTVFVLYLGSCLNLTSVQESKERSRIV